MHADNHTVTEVAHSMSVSFIKYTSITIIQSLYVYVYCIVYWLHADSYITMYIII